MPLQVSRGYREVYMQEEINCIDEDHKADEEMTATSNEVYD